MKKIKVLVLNSDTDGVGYARLLSPYTCLNDPDVSVDIRLLMDSSLQLHNDHFLKQYNIIVYNKGIPFNKPEQRILFLDTLKRHNIKLVFDIDDYWVLTNSHPNYKIWKKQNGRERVESELRDADAVTTTTHFLAEKIKEYNTNVTICPNSINLKEQQWVSEKLPRQNDKIRFLWGGGITHEVDLRLMKTSIESFKKDYLSKTQLFLCGYDLRMNTPQGMMKDDPRRSKWGFFESFFTNRGKWIKNSEYRSWLFEGDDNGRDNYGVRQDYISEFYQRRFTKPIMLYGTMYNECDVALAPLKNNNTFNQVKSQLKIIEAGAHKCPIICSDYGPYTIDDIEGKIDGIQKGFLVKESDGSAKWKECMEYYVENPDKVIEHGENLYNYVKDHYEVDVINKKRIELFRRLLDE